MLALLSRGAARLLDVRLETTAFSHLPEDEAFSIDINALASLLPSPDFSWHYVVGVYGQTISPMYRSIQTKLNEDVENIARLLDDLDPLDKEDEREIETDSETSTPASCFNHSVGTTKSLPNCRYKRWHPKNTSKRPLFIPSMHPSVPSILITPCAPPPRPCSSRVPLQDASYGNKLAVPGYPHLNSCFAPLILKPGHVPLVENWKWSEGHWWAVVPDLEVQGRKGWFSRPISSRRRAARHCRNEPLFVDSEES